MLNKIILIGRLTDDPELRYTANGTAVSNFTLAVNRSYKNKDGETDADFIDIVVWRKQAETASKHCYKGQLVAVEGRLQMSSYETDEGYNRRVSEVVASNVRFLEWPDDDKKNNKSEAEEDKGQVKEEDLDVPF